MEKKERTGIKLTLLLTIVSGGMFFFSGSRLLYPNHFSGGQSPQIVVKEVEPFVYFSLRQKGPFTLVEATINQLIETARSQNIYPAGPLIAIFHTAPADTKPGEMEWEVGFPVTPQALVQAPLEKKVWQFSPVASCVHVGPYDKTGETIQKMFEWLEENGYVQAGPVLETYLDIDPSKVQAQQLRTEIWIPCKKQTGL